MNEILKYSGLVVVVLRNVNTGRKWVFKTRNLIVATGELYYAERSAGESPTNAFDIMELGAGGAAVSTADNRSDMAPLVALSQKAFDATYPKTDDQDVDNDGAGVAVITYLTSYAIGEANDVGISDLIITNVSPGAAEPILMRAKFQAPFDKTSADTLKIFINHTPKSS